MKAFFWKGAGWAGVVCQAVGRTQSTPSSDIDWTRLIGSLLAHQWTRVLNEDLSPLRNACSTNGALSYARHDY